ITALMRRALMGVAAGKIDEELLTAEGRAMMLGNQEMQRSLNAFSLPVAIIHSSELVEQRSENDLRVYRYLLTDIGLSLLCTIKLRVDDKIASLAVGKP